VRRPRRGGARCDRGRTHRRRAVVTISARR
jgi:hypothetical protein